MNALVSVLILGIVGLIAADHIGHGGHGPSHGHSAGYALSHGHGHGVHGAGHGVGYGHGAGHAVGHGHGHGVHGAGYGHGLSGHGGHGHNAYPAGHGVHHGAVHGGYHAPVYHKPERKCKHTYESFYCPAVPKPAPCHGYSCKHSYAPAHKFHYAHPDKTCYWQCDEWGKATARPCPYGQTFNSYTQVCSGAHAGGHY